jgi:hypothetical protein
MKANERIAIIVVGLIIASLLNGGVYELRPVNGDLGFVAYRINRITGNVSRCNGFHGPALTNQALQFGCDQIPELPVSPPWFMRARRASRKSTTVIRPVSTISHSRRQQR